MKQSGKRCPVQDTDELRQLRNVGEAVRRDLALLGIKTVRHLAEQDPDEMYVRLQVTTNTSYDPCVWDVFAAIIHEAKTGEKLNWWEFTPQRKQRQKDNSFCRLSPRT